MSDFADLLSEGFAEMLASTDAPSITAANGQQAFGVCTAIGESREMREEGYWPKFGAVFEMTRADFDRLQLKDRAPVVYREAKCAANSKGRPVKVIGLEPDSTDPCIKITLKEDPAP